MKITDGGVVSAKGFKTAHTAAGIKYKDRSDMAMIVSELPCAVAGCFTTNVVKAAPVQWDQAIVKGAGAELFGAAAAAQASTATTATTAATTVTAVASSSASSAAATADTASSAADIEAQVSSAAAITPPARARAIVVNAGIANACTGDEGLGYCKATAEATGECLGISPATVLVASTGVIGKQLPIEKLVSGVKDMATKLSSDPAAATASAHAIMTTDTNPKEACAVIEIGGKQVTVGGMCKGSGMIHPNMCTMLSFVTTDINISSELLQEALSESVKDTYNMISVDGDTSTNDTVLVLANGMAGNDELTEKNADYEKFLEALNYVNETLAKMIAGDGEGCTALFEVKVTGAETKEQAATIAKSVVTSNLVKTAIYGHDANWGRVLCAMGYSGADFDPTCVDLSFVSDGGTVDIMKDGNALDFDEELATKVLSASAVTAAIDIKQGDATAIAWGCDLTLDYIKINADYRS